MNHVKDMVFEAGVPLVNYAGFQILLNVWVHAYESI